MHCKLSSFHLKKLLTLKFIDQIGWEGNTVHLNAAHKTHGIKTVSAFVPERLNTLPLDDTQISDNSKYLSYDMEDRYKMVPPFLRNFPPLTKFNYTWRFKSKHLHHHFHVIIQFIQGYNMPWIINIIEVVSTPHIYHLELLIFCSSMRSNWPKTWEHFRPCFTLCKWTLSQCHDFELLYQVRKIIISVNSYHRCPWMVSSRIYQETGAQVQFLTMLNTY